MAPLLTAEQLELKDSLRTFLADQVSLAVVRKIFEGDTTLRSTVWGKLMELGVLSFFAESHSAGGGTVRELGMLASEAGYALCPENLLEAAFVTHLLHTQLSETERSDVQSRFGADFLGLLSSGALRSSIAVSSIATSSGASLSIEEGAKDGEVNLKARYVAGGDCCQVILAIDSNSGTIWLCDHRVGRAASVQRCPEKLLDRSQSLYAVEIRGCQAVKLFSLNPSTVWLQWAAIKSSEIAGAARRTLEGTVEYLKTREQFDVPIGGFQALQHAAADMMVKVEAMHALSDFACWSASFSPDQLALAAHSATLFCAEEAPKVVEKAIQLHGGIGFTWEHDLHLFLRRIRTVAALVAPDDAGKESLLLAALGA